MSRNQTLAQWYRAEFKGVPFGGPGTKAWEPVGHWQASETLPFALSTVVRDLMASENGWRELSEYAMRQSFPHGVDGRGLRVDRAFVSSQGGSRHGQIVTLTDKRKGLLP